MKILISHIEYLLTENDCVIVPGLGGFVVQQHNAMFSETGILPPFREICFNPGLVHDDGMLLSSISQTQGVSYAEARRLLNNELGIFKASLSQQEKVSFGAVGSFSIDYDQTLLFEPADSLITRIDSFGFAPLQMKPLEEILIKPKTVEHKPFAEKEGDIIHIRFSKRKMLRAAVSTAVILILWVFSSPVGDKRYNASCAGLLPQMDFQKTSKVEIPKKIIPAKKVVETVQKSDTVDVKLAEKTIVPKDTVDTEERERYFIVLGSFQTEKAALKHQEQLIGDGISEAKVKKMGSKMRTYLKAFSDKESAMKYLNKIRDDREEYNEAWLYCMR